MLRIFLILTFIYITTDVQSQVEEFMMRNETQAYQHKPQIRGEISQKVHILSTDSPYIMLSHNIGELLSNHSMIYVSPHSSGSYRLNYRGYLSENMGFNLDDMPIMLSSSLPMSWLSSLNQLTSKVEVLYGQNSLNSGIQAQGASLHFYSTPTEFTPVKTHKLNSSLAFNSNTLGITNFGSLSIHKPKYNSHTQWHYTRQSQYIIGAALPDQFGQWGQNVGSQEPHSMPHQDIFQLGLSQKFSFKISDLKSLEWTTYIAKNKQGASIHPIYGYMLDEVSPWIHSKVKLTLLSDQKWYTKLNLGIAYTHLENNKYDPNTQINTEVYSKNNSIAVYLDMYKNVNARWVVFWNTQMHLEGVAQKKELTWINIGNQKLENILGLKTSAKVEYRHSDNTSYLLGVNLEGQSLSLNYLDRRSSQSDFKPLAQKFGSIGTYITWTRHSCESNNYSISLYASSSAPNITNILQTHFEGNMTPRLNYSNINTIGIESHFYKKFDDRFEIQVSPYTHYIFNPISIQTNYNQPIIIPNGYQYLDYTIINESRPIFQIGTALESKYHITKQHLLYTTAQYAYGIQSDTPQSRIPPLYAQLGIKSKLPKLSTHLWIQINVTKTDAQLGAYDQNARFMAATSSAGFQIYPAFWVLNSEVNFKINSHFSSQLGVYNWLNQNYRPFDANLSAIGRNARIQLSISL